MIINVLIGFHFLLGISLVLLILLQKSSSFGMGLYSEESLGKMDILSKLTLLFLFILLINDFLLGNLLSHGIEENVSIFNK